MHIYTYIFFLHDYILYMSWHLNIFRSCCSFISSSKISPANSDDMPAAEWRVNKEFFLLVAALLGSILPGTTSSAETQDRWESLQEVLRMTANAVQKLEERSALCKVSLFLCAAWETKVNKDLPSCFPVENGQVCLKGYVPDEALDLPRLQRNADFHLGEFDRAEGDLAALMSHCRESGFEDLLQDMTMAQNALAMVVDKLSGR